MFPKIYYESLIAAQAGLCGWFIANFIVSSSTYSETGETVILTTIPAIAIGGAIASVEKIRSAGWSGTVYILYGAVAGLIGGAVGGFLFSEVFKQLSGSNPLFARIIGCLVLGIFIAAGESARLRSWIRARFGIIGGSIGGLIGGWLYHTFSVQTENIILLQALIFVLFGALIALGIHLMVSYSSNASLVGHDDNFRKCRGHISELHPDIENVIGSGASGRSTQKATIHINSDDTRIDPLHAVIRWNPSGRYELMPYYVYKSDQPPPAGEETYVNGNPIEDVYHLRENDLIQLGRSNKFYFRVKT